MKKITWIITLSILLTSIFLLNGCNNNQENNKGNLQVKQGKEHISEITNIKNNDEKKKDESNKDNIFIIDAREDNNVLILQNDLLKIYNIYYKYKNLDKEINKLKHIKVILSKNLLNGIKIKTIDSLIYKKCNIDKSNMENDIIVIECYANNNFEKTIKNISNEMKKMQSGLHSIYLFSIKY